jgi:N-acyl-D-aspartate/D-glutamate deacylase
MPGRRCTRFVALLLAVLVLGGDAQTPGAAAEKFDLLIRNARVVDGSGNPWFWGEVAVRGERIVRVGRLGTVTGEAARVIEAGGLVVAPGFIDMHSHSDYSLLLDGNGESKVRQGVTTEILGESGSAAPRCPSSVPDEEPPPYDLELDWTDFDGYFARLMRQGIAVNIGSHVGAGSVRRCGMGLEMRAPTPAEIDKMKALVEQAMRQGALGLSTGLIYPPNSYATTNELVELARVAAAHGGMFTSHMRNESDQIIEAIQEIITVAEQARLPVHIIHLKTTYAKAPGRMVEVVNFIEQARQRGVPITADQYPYIATSTGLTARLPDWLQDGGNAAMLKRLRDPEVRARIRQEHEAAGGYEWERAVIAQVKHSENKPLEGRSIRDVAAERKQDPLDTVFELLLAEKGTVRMVYFAMHEEDVAYAMRQPWVSVGSDGTAVKPEGILGEGRPHPRFYGTFPRVLGKYVREQKVISLEQAVRKMTSLAAQQAGIRDRGMLRAGMKADIVIFDPQRIIDKATFAEPHQYAEGVQYVLVNGKAVLDNGRRTGARPGQIVYGPGKK